MAGRNPRIRPRAPGPDHRLTARSRPTGPHALTTLGCNRGCLGQRFRTRRGSVGKNTPGCAGAFVGCCLGRGLGHGTGAWWTRAWGLTAWGLTRNRRRTCGQWMGGKHWRVLRRFDWSSGQDQPDHHSHPYEVLKTIGSVLVNSPGRDCAFAVKSGRWLHVTKSHQKPTC